MNLQQEVAKAILSTVDSINQLGEWLIELDDETQLWINTTPEGVYTVHDADGVRVAKFQVTVNVTVNP